MYPLTLSGLDDAIEALAERHAARDAVRDAARRPLAYDMQDERPLAGLVLTGGGARAAYQVGRAQGHRRAVAARLPLPLSDRHRHLRRRGERHRHRLGSRRISATRCTPSRGCGASFVCTM